MVSIWFWYACILFCGSSLIFNVRMYMITHVRIYIATNLRRCMTTKSMCACIQLRMQELLWLRMCGRWLQICSRWLRMCARIVQKTIFFPDLMFFPRFLETPEFSECPDIDECPFPPYSNHVSCLRIFQLSKLAQMSFLSRSFPTSLFSWISPMSRFARMSHVPGTVHSSCFFRIYRMSRVAQMSCSPDFSCRDFSQYP